jgi:hypothetical protein
VYALFEVQKEKEKTRTSPSFVCDKMCVHWREREHGELDILIKEDHGSIGMLKQCGLLKLFQCTFMRVQLRLLNALVEY